MQNSVIAKVSDRVHLEGFFDKISQVGRDHLDRMTELLADHKISKSALFSWARENRAYPLMCGFSQEMIVYNFQDSGLEVRPFTSDSIGESPFRHCAAVVPIKIDGESSPRTFMIDLTFQQFALPADLYPEFGLRDIFERKSPFRTLRQTQEGRELWNNLAQKGYFEVTKDTASLYVGSLFPRTVISPDKALHCLENPAYHATNLQHGRSRLQEMHCLDIPVAELLKLSGSGAGAKTYDSLPINSSI